MHLKVQDRKGRKYLSVVQNYRQAGKTKTRTIETIGYADAYTDRFEDPIAHFREYVNELNAQSASHRRPIDLAFGAGDAIEPNAAPPARLGAFIALGCLDAIGVRGFFQPRAGRVGFPKHAGRIFEMLATERMMHAASKRESWTARASFPRSCDFGYDEVYAALSCFARESVHLEAHLSRQARRNRGRESALRDCLYVPCGTYQFLSGGSRQSGSVLVGLDEAGMPTGYRAVMGRLDPHNMQQAVDELKGDAGAPRAVAITAALRDPAPAMAELAANGDGFVILQPNPFDIPNLAGWIQDIADYVDVADGARMKWRNTVRTLEDGTMLPVREVVLAGGSYSMRKGHALLVSSETAMPPLQIVQLFRELWRQAEPFQPLEADFSAMPVPVPTHEHIQAHFSICFAAFSALRALRAKVGWQHNAADTADALLRMEGVYLQQNYYLFNYRSATTDDIEAAVGIPPARRLRTREELRSIPRTVRQSLAETRRES